MSDIIAVYSIIRFQSEVNTNRGVKRTLTVSFQFYHTQMDGAHASRFLENLQKGIRNLKV